MLEWKCWILCLFVVTKPVRKKLLYENFKLQVDDEWLATVRWSVSHLCDEGDLACEDEALGRRPSQEIKLIRLLTVLINKTEVTFSSFLPLLDALLSVFSTVHSITRINSHCWNPFATME